MNDFDDLVSRSLADRAGRAEPPTPDLTGLQRDMKRHLAKRRGVAAGGAVILVAGLGTVLALRSPARPPLRLKARTRYSAPSRGGSR